MTIEIISELECGHLLATGETKREMLYCVMCNEIKHIVGQTLGYSAQCLDCSFRRLYGLARLTAYRAADAHLTRYPFHTLAVRKGRLIENVVRRSEKILELPLDKPPF